MSPLRTIAVGLLLASACGQDPPPAPASAPATKAASTERPRPTPSDDPHAIAKARDDQPPPPDLGPSIGTFDATIDGRTTHFLRLPRGQNRAISIPDRGVARVTISAAEGHEGWPHLQLVLEGLKLDAVTLPLTLPSDAPGIKDVQVIVRYQVNDNRKYAIDPSKDATMKVTLERFAGNELTGSFEGRLAPTAAGLGEPIAVSGRFAVQLGLRGITPGPGGAPLPPDGSFTHELPADPTAHAVEPAAAPDQAVRARPPADPTAHAVEPAAVPDQADREQPPADQPPAL